MSKNNQSKNTKNSDNNLKTTGHSWDQGDIQEYNTPAPRWWLIVWIICIIWAVIYWFFYPTWPTPEGNNKGLKNWTSQSQLKESQDEITKKKQVYLDKFNKSNFAEIMQDKDLLDFALNGGKIAFLENCAACHGTGAMGQKGYPNLNDDDWIWGGKINDIYITLLYGIRSGHPKSRESAMPAFGLDKILNKEEIAQVTDYVLSLSNSGPYNKKGKIIFKNNCASCHQNNGKGDMLVGAPNLTDKIWLYGKSKEEIIHTITYSKAGVMPYWSGRLDDATIRQLTIYVHLLGGGK